MGVCGSVSSAVKSIVNKPYTVNVTAGIIFPPATADEQELVVG